MYHVALVIEGANVHEDSFIDVFGINSYQDIQDRYMMPGKQTIEVKTESELKYTSLFNDIEIQKAKKN